MKLFLITCVALLCATCAQADLPVPQPPARPVATQAEPGTITLTWDDPNPYYVATAYVIYERGDGGEYRSWCAASRSDRDDGSLDNVGAGRAQTWSGVAEGDHYYVVETYNMWHRSALSEACLVRVNYGPPLLPPANLRGE